MKFAVYQTRDQETKLALMMAFEDSETVTTASNAWDKGLYTHVANITAADFDEVFEIGNIGPEQNIERLARMSSISVGDVIVGEDGTIAVVAEVGFIAFGFNPKMAA